MPLICIYQCPVCQTTQRTDHGAPVPLHCGEAMRWRQTRDFKPEQHGWSTGQKAPHVGFHHTKPWVVPVEGNGPDGQTEVTSLRQIRHLESESAKRAADGVGQEMRFRAFNNDTVNGGMLTNSFGDPPQRAPQLYDTRGRQKISFDVVDGEPVEVMGDGADESLASALPDSPTVSGVS